MLSIETVRVDDGGKNIAHIATNTGDIVALPLEFAGVMIYIYIKYIYIL